MRSLVASTPELFIQDDQFLQGRDGLKKQVGVIYCMTWLLPSGLLQCI